MKPFHTLVKNNLCNEKSCVCQCYLDPTMNHMYRPSSFDKPIPYISTNVGQLLLFDMGSLLGLGINNLLARYQVF